MLFCNFLLINKFLRRMQRVCLSMCVPLVFCFSSFNGILWLYLTFKLKGRFHSLLLIIWNKWTKQRRRRQRQRRRRRRRRWKIQNPNRISISIICIHFKLTHILDIVVRLAGNRTTYVQVSNGCVCVFCELCVCCVCPVWWQATVSFEAMIFNRGPRCQADYNQINDNRENIKT